MEHEPWLEKWSYEDDKVILEYEDGATLRVTREDFIRAFGVIIGLTKADPLTSTCIICIIHA